jgi:hypothetical protein
MSLCNQIPAQDRTDFAYEQISPIEAHATAQPSATRPAESQIAELKERISADGAQIVEDMCFVDAGVSGARR